MISVSDELRRERELRGVSLEQMARETRISVRFLQAVDSGRLQSIPGEFYRRAYLRAYARYLGLNEERVVAAYQYSIGASSVTAEARAADVGETRFLSRYSREAKWGALLLAAVGLTGAAAAVWPRGPAKMAPLPAVLDTAGSSVTSMDPMPTPFLGEVVEEERTDGAPLRVVLDVKEPCWLQVSADGSLVVEGLMLRGFRKEIQARHEVRLWLGNAGGVSLSINGSPAKPLGLAGQVRKDVLITAENFEDFVES